MRFNLRKLLLFMLLTMGLIIIVKITTHNQELIYLLNGFFLGLIVNTIIHDNTIYLIKEAKYNKSFMMLDILVYFLVTLFSIFVIRNFMFFIGLAINIIGSRLILYKSMAKLIRED